MGERDRATGSFRFSRVSGRASGQMKTGKPRFASFPVVRLPEVSAFVFHGAAMRCMELERQRNGRDSGQQQRDAYPYDDYGRAEDQRLEEHPQGADQQQHSAGDRPAWAGHFQGTHVAAQADCGEGAKQEPEPQNDGQHGGRKRHVEDQDQTQDDLDDAAGQHPAAARHEVVVGCRDYRFQDTCCQHRPAEDDGHAHIALRRIDEYQNAQYQQGDADQKHQPPVAYGLLRPFDQ